MTVREEQREGHENHTWKMNIRKTKKMCYYNEKNNNMDMEIKMAQNLECLRHNCEKRRSEGMPRKF